MITRYEHQITDPLSWPLVKLNTCRKARYRDIAQLVEQMLHTHQVSGSIPLVTTNFKTIYPNTPIGRAKHSYGAKDRKSVQTNASLIDGQVGTR